MESSDSALKYYIRPIGHKSVKQLGDELHVAGIETARPSLRNAMKLAEYKLRSNSHKTGWQDLSLSELTRMAQGELVELREALRIQQTKPSTKHIIEAALEAADVINYMHMIIDNLLENRYGPRGGGE